MHQRLTALLAAAVILLLPCLSAHGIGLKKDAGKAQPDKAPTLWGKELPKPDLATLAKRAHPDFPYDKDNTAQKELLYLRERPDPKAYPVLKKILDQSKPNKRIFEFAAMQALYTLNTKASLALLAKTLRDPAMLGQTQELIRYAFTWEMDPKQTAGLIEDYLLKNPSKDITIKLGLDPGTARGGGIGIDVRFSNTTRNALAWSGTGKYYNARGLLLRDKQGTYYMPHARVKYDALADQITTLAPGGSTLMRRVVMSATPKQEGVKRLVLYSSDMAFDLPGPGEYQAVYFLEKPKLNEKQRAALKDKGATWWAGRAVSNTIKITVKAPSPIAPPRKPGPGHMLTPNQK